MTISWRLEIEGHDVLFGDASFYLDTNNRWVGEWTHLDEETGGEETGEWILEPKPIAAFAVERGGNAYGSGKGGYQEQRFGGKENMPTIPPFHASACEAADL